MVAGAAASVRGATAAAGGRAAVTSGEGVGAGGSASADSGEEMGAGAVAGAAAGASTAGRAARSGARPTLPSADATGAAVGASVCGAGAGDSPSPPPSTNTAKRPAPSRPSITPRPPCLRGRNCANGCAGARAAPGARRSLPRVCGAGGGVAGRADKVAPAAGKGTAEAAAAGDLTGSEVVSAAGTVRASADASASPGPAVPPASASSED